MRYLVLSDIHANLEALDACLADAAPRRAGFVLVLGDIVGYGPNPNEVVERVRALDPVAVVRGNHDKVASGLETADGFNVVARAAAYWTLDHLAPGNRAWVANLPPGPVQVDHLVEICHGSPFDEDAYVFDELDAVRALRSSKRRLCLFGHTHYPTIFSQSGTRLDAVVRSRQTEWTLALEPSAKYLLNPGSIGQPRDGDPRAAYAVVDSEAETVELVRVEYPVEMTQGKIVEAGLPQVLADRLTAGR